MDLTPSAIATAGPVKPKLLYDLRSIEIATALGSLLAGAFLMSRNFTALGERDRARKALIAGVLGLVPIAVVTVSYVVPEKLVKLDQALWQAGQALLMHFIAKRQLGSVFLAHKESEGMFYSRWRAAGISVVVAPFALLVLMAVGFAYLSLSNQL